MIISFKNKESIENNLKVEILSKNNIYIFKNVKTCINFVSKKGVYKLNIYNYNGCINSYYFINNGYNDLCIFYTETNEKRIKLYLTDCHYKNLPIERGEIKLWQKI